MVMAVVDAVAQAQAGRATGGGIALPEAAGMTTPMTAQALGQIGLQSTLRGDGCTPRVQISDPDDPRAFQQSYAGRIDQAAAAAAAPAAA